MSASKTANVRINVMLFSGRSASDKSELIDGMAENFVAIDFVAIDKVFFEVGLI